MLYSTIVADPPWPYKDANKDTSTLQIRRELLHGTQVKDLGYPTMTLAELKALQVREIAAKNAHLYLWTTNAFMVEAHDLARAWGFEPKTIITWVKTRQNDGQPSMKTGYYYRGATEHILFCVRGSLRLQGSPHATAFFTPRDAHSKKPDYSYEMIEAQSPGPYLEMFARRSRAGWDAWGNEVECAINLTSLDTQAA